MAKGLEALRARSAKKAEEDHTSGGTGMTPLFPNGEKDEIIRAISDLRREARHRYDECQELKICVREIQERLGTP